MFVILGATGQVGGAAARGLLDRNMPVRAVVRDVGRADPLVARGAQPALADFSDAEALAAVMRGAEGAFVMLPPNFSPSRDYAEARTLAATLRRALSAARPDRVVCLSSVGAHRESGLGLVTQLRILEQELAALDLPVAFVRAAWFMENLRRDIPMVRATGELPSFLQPLNRAIPMVATADVGNLVAQTMQTGWTGRRVLEIAGPGCCPNDLAEALSAALRRPVRAVETERGRWEELLRGAGIPDPAPLMEMVDGFNSGWITFEGKTAESVRGETPLAEVVASLVAE
ncbi:NmrA family protein [Desulfovibrio sp. X2]|uniref:NmrA family NAD(P)-binding protein n=1 Tax=Desulfovibrio sp. X2 TaxID=941449 RepID=UPI000358E7B3|nr:NmrA family NAD(P)-binding protein [Desulfovibrio sp. X2]EPR42125.1 NmrA family protein [Desulfovibrio sp. X2]